MFPTQRDDEPLFDEDPASIFDHLDELVADCPAIEGNDLIADMGVSKRPRKTSSANEIQENKNEGGSDSKKVVHREIERQRRQEMSGLYASLRSLLPLEYVKGRRAISDHMHQAMNYIKDMQKKIKELKIRRDKLVKLHGVPGASIDAENPNTNINFSPSPYCVSVNHRGDGLEIIISSRLNEKCFPLSKVLADLIGRGLNVISCVSTRGDQCFVYKLEIELQDPTIDISGLQERLDNVIKLA